MYICDFDTTWIFFPDLHWQHKQRTHKKDKATNTVAETTEVMVNKNLKINLFLEGDHNMEKLWQIKRNEFTGLSINQYTDDNDWWVMCTFDQEKSLKIKLIPPWTLDKLDLAFRRDGNRNQNPIFRQVWKDKYQIGSTLKLQDNCHLADMWFSW